MLEQVAEKRFRVVIVDGLAGNGSCDIALVLRQLFKALQCCLVHGGGVRDSLESLVGICGSSNRELTCAEREGDKAEFMIPKKIICPFQKGQRYRLIEVEKYLARLSSVRQGDKSLSCNLRVRKGKFKQEFDGVFDELYPLHRFARHLGIVKSGEFEWQFTGKRETGADFIVYTGNKVRPIQVTTTGPIWSGSSPQNPGYQRRLSLEMLNAEGMSSGWGPFRRKEDGTVVGECNDSILGEEVRKAFCDGLIAAYNLKKKFRPGGGCELVVQLSDATESIDVDDFHTVVAQAKSFAPVHAFARIHIVDYGDGYYHAIPGCPNSVTGD